MQKPFVEPEAGYQFEPRVITVSKQYQDEKLLSCGLEPARYQGHVDISFLIGLGIQFGIQNGISAEGNVNMLQSLSQSRAIPLDEPLTAKGFIANVTSVPRGRVIDTKVWFEDAEGVEVADASRRSLKPDPAKVGTRGAGERPAPVLEQPWDVLGEFTLNPDQVVEYSSEGNSIHYEPEAARQAGFRAPIIGGGMGVHYIMHGLWQEGIQAAVGMDIYFRRPIFWDERFSLVRNNQAAGLVRPDGKVLTEVKLG